MTAFIGMFFGFFSYMDLESLFTLLGAKMHSLVISVYVPVAGISHANTRV